MYHVTFYTNKKGNPPVKDYLLELRDDDYSLFEHIVSYIRLLEDKGTWLGMPYVKHLGDGIWELRPMSERILFFVDDGGTIILLLHFHKKSKKTPSKKIETAKKRRKYYLMKK